MSDILVLGGGFGGLTTANSLRSGLSSEHTVTVLDRKPSFLMGLAKLWVLKGERTAAEGRMARSLLEKKGIRFLHDEITRIDLDAKTVQMSTTILGFDYLVVALGADMVPESLPGFQEGALNLYEVDQVQRAHMELSGFTQGDLVLMICDTPFKCPPAPYEAAMLIDDMLRKQGVRENVNLQLYSAEPMPVPVAGPANSAIVQGWLKDREIGYHANHKPTTIQPTEREVFFENGTKVHYDLLLAVPPHQAPKVVKESGLTDGMGWVPVDPKTLKTKKDNVYAIGDVTVIRLANGLMLPKAGIFAEAQGNVVAQEIIGQIEGTIPLVGFDGRGFCFMETGDGKASLVKGEFFAAPNPSILISPPDEKSLEEKRAFEETRLRNWF